MALRVRQEKKCGAIRAEGTEYAVGGRVFGGEQGQ